MADSNTSSGSACSDPASSGPSWSIGQICDKTGLSARTVRYYEELGLLPGVRRREAGRRAYSRDELERLRFIQRLKTLGLSLAEIKDLNQVHAISNSTHALLERLEELLDQRLGDLDDRIGELQTLRDQMGKYHAHVSGRIEKLNGTQGGSR
ncbi:MAG: MerR family transcriptional regulator [Myxococcota bacterium]|nr:MerR family transcriptional regulator [Myxococcota bacterium]